MRCAASSTAPRGRASVSTSSSVCRRHSSYKGSARVLFLVLLLCVDSSSDSWHTASSIDSLIHSTHASLYFHISHQHPQVWRRFSDWASAAGSSGATPHSEPPSPQRWVCER